MDYTNFLDVIRCAVNKCTLYVPPLAAASGRKTREGAKTLCVQYKIREIFMKSV